MTVFTKIVTGIFGKKSDRDMKFFSPVIDKINTAYAPLQYLSDDELRRSFKKIRDAFIKESENLIGDLSNWYIRRNRRRFWRSENDTDKKAAYSTLYKILLNYIKVMSPVVPFLTEEIYQNLVSYLYTLFW